MKVVILGCGRVGSRLATLMVEDGHDVSIIDSDPAAFSNRLPSDFAGQTVMGTGIDVDVLKSAGIKSADVFAAVTNFDNTNIMACEIAKEIFGVKRVLARIYDPGRESFYHELGLETVCPTTLVANAAHNILSPEHIHSEPRQTAPLPRVVERGASDPSAGQSSNIAAPASLAANPPAAPAGTAPSVPGTAPLSKADPEPLPAHEEAQKNGRGLRGFFRP